MNMECGRKPWVGDATVEVVKPALPQNPKDILGVKKIDLSLVPAIGIAHEATAFTDGAMKYGPYNWRENAVLARVYIAAARRHLDLWEAGEEYSDDAKVHNLGAARACLGILLDAQLTGNLIDNRPKSGAFVAAMAKINDWVTARVAAATQTALQEVDGGVVISEPVSGFHVFVPSEPTTDCPAAGKKLDGGPIPEKFVTVQGHDDTHNHPDHH
jgi:hypothetical protein